MTDIVDQLRKKAMRGVTMEAAHTRTLEWKAADEIERLQGLVNTYQELDRKRFKEALSQHQFEGTK